MKQVTYASPFGTLFLIFSDRGLTGLYWNEQNVPLADTQNEQMTQAFCELDEYFAGNRKTFSIPLDLKGTPFQLKVWNELLKIPYGETRSYLEIAHNIKQEKAARAVGSANGKNPVCIIVPCHRIIRSAGEMGGYLGGVQVKQKLLELEGSKTRPSRQIYPQHQEEHQD